MTITMAAGITGDNGGLPPGNQWRRILRQLGMQVVEAAAIGFVLILAVLILLL